jgi:hypothetical protein
MRYNDSHDFTNDSSKTVTIMLEPGEKVRLFDSSRRNDYADYSGEEFGYELEVPAGARVETLVFAD